MEKLDRIFFDPVVAFKRDETTACSCAGDDQILFLEQIQ